MPDTYLQSIKDAIKRHSVLYAEHEAESEPERIKIGMAYVNGMHCVCRWLCLNDGELTPQLMDKALYELFAELGFKVESLPLPKP